MKEKLKNNYKGMILSIFPSVAFYMVYRIYSYKYAILTGFVIGFLIYGCKYKKFKKITAFDKIGIFGLVIQTVIGIVAENPKTYFLYPLMQNIVLSSICLVSLVMKTNAISYIAKDFSESEEIQEILNPAYRRLTLIWGLYFIFRMVIKIVGLIKLSFDQLYVINWFSGAPINALLLLYSFWYPNEYLRRLRENKSI